MFLREHIHFTTDSQIIGQSRNLNHFHCKSKASNGIQNKEEPQQRQNTSQFYFRSFAFSHPDLQINPVQFPSSSVSVGDSFNREFMLGRADHMNS